jgi:hypothetical protein
LRMKFVERARAKSEASEHCQTEFDVRLHWFSP